MQKELITGSFVTALKNIRQNPIPYLRFNLLFFAIIFLVNYFAAILSMKITYDRDLQEIILVIIKIPVNAYFIGGFIYFYVSSVRGVSIRVAQIFRGYRWYSEILIYEVLVYFFYLLLVKPAGDFFDFPAVIQARLILGVLVYLYLFLKTSFFLAIVVDSRLPCMKALSESFLLTRGYARETGLSITFGIMIILSGLLAAGIGIIFTMAVGTLGYVLLYDTLGKIRRT